MPPVFKKVESEIYTYYQAILLVLIFSTQLLQAECN